MSVGMQTLPKPADISAEMPISARICATIATWRQQIQAIVTGQDPRLLIVVGPCSLHHASGAIAFAQQLAAFAQPFEDRALFVMRAYVAKPRSVGGWKGMAYDPSLDGRNDITMGLKQSRQCLVNILEQGVPLACEFIDSFLPAYLTDCVSYVTVGARSVEDPLHREIASQLPCAVGFKNATTGALTPALDAVITAKNPQPYLTINDQGQAVLINTPGNAWGHLILRGSHAQSNFAMGDLERAIDYNQQRGIHNKLMIDCSHGNAARDHWRQLTVLDQVAQMLPNYRAHVAGVMIEATKGCGRSDDRSDPHTSITDPCLPWDTLTEALNRFLCA